MLAPVTYLVKIKPMESAVNVQERVIDAFKRQDWIIAVEKMKNPLCFYGRTGLPGEFQVLPAGRRHLQDCARFGRQKPAGAGI